jgi:hypothetical protein
MSNRIFANRTFAGAMRANKMPQLAHIVGGRRAAMAKGGEITGPGKYPFFYFCNSIVECVAGKKEWKNQKAKKLISESCITVSDEAFAILLMQNSWAKFEYIAENCDFDEKKNVPETLFTEKKGRNRRLQGWSETGIDNFNELCAMVEEDRKSAAGKLFEAEFLKYQEDKAKDDKSNVVEEDDGESDGEGTEPVVKKARFVYNHLKDLAGVGLKASEVAQV